MTSYAHPCRRSTARCQSAVHSTRHVINMHMQQLHANQHSSIADSDRRKTSVSLCSHRRKHRGGRWGRVPPRIRSGGTPMLFVPPRFWPVGHMLCNESLSSAQVPGLKYSSPPGSRCGMTRIRVAPLRPLTAVMFRRDVTASAFCRRVISCLLAKNAGNLLPSVTLMMYTDKLCYTN